MSSIPKASEVMEVVEERGVSRLGSLLKGCDLGELLKVMKLAIVEVEKKMKVEKMSKSSSVKKTGSMPKGVVPKQLRKPRAWVVFVLEYVNREGWESFVVHHTLKDKTVENIIMVESEKFEDRHIYKESRTEMCPKGKSMIHKDAMSLSKQYWTPKTKTGTRYDLYQEFEKGYVEEPDIVKKEEVEEEEEEEEEKEEEVKVEAVKVEAVKVEAVKVEAVKEVEEVKVTPQKVKREVVPMAPKKVTKKAKWSCPNDGVAYEWIYKGQAYLRNFDNCVWLKNGDDAGDWQGMYNEMEDNIDDSVEEPEEYVDRE